MLVDAETLELAPGVERLLGPEGLKTELFSCLVETNTPVCESAAEARDELVRLRGVVARGRRAARASRSPRPASHPFSRAEEQEIVDEPRYLKMLEELGPKLRPASSSAACTCTSAWRASTRACGRSRRSFPGCRPCSPSRSTRRTSQGEETGALSARAARLGELPRGGQPPSFASPEDWEADDRGDRAGLHAQLVGRASASAARHARGADRRPADERRPLGGARRAGPGALRGRLRRSGSRAATRGERPLPRAARRRPRACSTLVEPAARELGTWELVETLREPAGGAAAARGRAPRRPRRRGGRPRGAPPHERHSARRSIRCGSSARGSAGAALRSSSSCSGSPRARRSSSAAAQARSSRRIARSRRRSSGSRKASARFGRSGSASRLRATSRSPCSTAARAQRLAARRCRRTPTSLVLFRETTIAGAFAGLGGVEGLGRLGDAALRPAAASPCIAGALRGAAAAGRGAGCRSRRRPAARRGGRGGAEQPRPLRRLPAADRQRARRRRGEPFPRARSRLPPAAAAAALPRRRGP